jgi:hypothetical protein
LRAATVLPRGESTTIELGNFDLCARAETLGAFFGLPSASKALAGRRPETSLEAIRRALGEAAQDDREAARRRVRLDR